MTLLEEKVPGYFGMPLEQKLNLFHEMAASLEHTQSVASLNRDQLVEFLAARMERAEKHPELSVDADEFFASLEAEFGP